MSKEKKETAVAKPVAVAATAAVKTPRVRKSDVNVNGTVVSITYAPDGAAVTKDFDLSALSPEIVEALAIHGLKQKLTDAFAGVDLANINEAIEKSQGVWDNLVAGNFTAQRGDGSPRTGKLAEAIARLTGKPLEEVTKALDGLKDTEAGEAKLKALRSDAAVKAMMNRIRQEELDAAASANKSSLLESFG